MFYGNYGSWRSFDNYLLVTYEMLLCLYRRWEYFMLLFIARRAGNFIVYVRDKDDASRREVDLFLGVIVL